jgi:hypothetical protein
LRALEAERRLVLDGGGLMLLQEGAKFSLHKEGGSVGREGRPPV